MEDDIIKLLKSAYDSGYEDGVTFKAYNIKCNDFDDVLIENYLEIKRIVNKIDETIVNKQKELSKPPTPTVYCDVCGYPYEKTPKGTKCMNPLCGR